MLGADAKPSKLRFRENGLSEFSFWRSIIIYENLLLAFVDIPSCGSFDFF